MADAGLGFPDALLKGVWVRESIVFEDVSLLDPHDFADEVDVAPEDECYHEHEEAVHACDVSKEVL